MTRSTLRRSSAAVVVVLALSSLAACGDDGDGDETSSAGSSSASTGDPSDDPSGESNESDGTGESDGEDEPDADAGEDISADEFIDIYLDALDQATTATFEMDFGGSMAVKGSGVADFGETPPAMKLTMTDASTKQNQEVIILDGIMYLLLPDKSYMKYDLSDPNGLLGSDVTDQLDPSAMAEVFEKGITDSSYLGEDDVDGEPMERYRVEVDSAALFDKADLAPAAPTDAVADEITFDIWFDGEGNLRRQQADTGASAGQIALSYDNWGDPVTIKAPPKSKITEIPGA